MIFPHTLHSPVKISSPIFALTTSFGLDASSRPRLSNHLIRSRFTIALQHPRIDGGQANTLRRYVWEGELSPISKRQKKICLDPKSPHTISVIASNFVPLVTQILSSLLFIVIVLACKQKYSLVKCHGWKGKLVTFGIYNMRKLEVRFFYLTFFLIGESFEGQRKGN